MQCNGNFICLFSSFISWIAEAKKDLSINAYFYEKSHVLDNLIQPDYLILASDLEDNQTDDRLLGLGVRNNCGDDVVLVGFIDRAHFNYSPKTLIKRMRQHKRKTSSFPTAHGYLSINSRYGDMPYLFRSPVKILRGQQMLFCIDYDCLKRTPLDREKSNLFDLKKPLSIYAVDIFGALYKSTFKIPAENFITEKTCTMKKDHWLD